MEAAISQGKRNWVVLDRGGTSDLRCLNNKIDDSGAAMMVMAGLSSIVVITSRRRFDASLLGRVESSRETTS